MGGSGWAMLGRPSANMQGQGAPHLPDNRNQLTEAAQQGRCSGQSQTIPRRRRADSMLAWMLSVVGPANPCLAVSLVQSPQEAPDDPLERSADQGRPFRRPSLSGSPRPSQGPSRRLG
jgi:hypothetical protein